MPWVLRDFLRLGSVQMLAAVDRAGTCPRAANVIEQRAHPHDFIVEGLNTPFLRFVRGLAGDAAERTALLRERCM
jgi:hypothetical protein